MKHILILIFFSCFFFSNQSAQKSYAVDEPQYYSLSLNAIGGDATDLGLELQAAMHLKRGTSFYIGGALADASFSFDHFFKIWGLIKNRIWKSNFN